MQLPIGKVVYQGIICELTAVIISFLNMICFFTRWLQVLN